MGYLYTNAVNPSTPQFTSNCSKEEASSRYLTDLYEQINHLPTRHDIRVLLKKCVYSILVDDDVNEEIHFISEVRRLLNEIKGNSNPDYVAIIDVIKEIYQFAVDKEIDKNVRVKREEMMVDDDVLKLFEVNGRYAGEGEEPVEDDSSEENNEVNNRGNMEQEESDDDSCEFQSVQNYTWRPVSDNN